MNVRARVFKYEGIWYVDLWHCDGRRRCNYIGFIPGGYPNQSVALRQAPFWLRAYAAGELST